MSGGFVGAMDHRGGLPALRQLFDRRDVHVAVVEKFLQIGHVLLKKAAIGPNGVAAQGNGSGFNARRAQEVECRLFSFGARHGGRANLVEKT